MRLTTTFLACSASVALADHGREFLLVQDAHVGKPGDGSVALNTGWEKMREGGTEFSIEPNVVVPIMERLALGSVFSFADGERSFRYQSVSPMVLWQLTPDQTPVLVSLQAGYQFADSDGDSMLQDEKFSFVEKESTSGDGHDHGAHDHGDDSTGHSDSSGHHHGVSGFQGRLVAETNFGSTKAIANLVYNAPEAGDSGFGYAVAVRQQLTKEWSVGLEAVGDMGADETDRHELLIGSYFSPIHDITLKAGAGLGLTDASPEFTVRLGAVWRF
jgi:hypothetical protein